MEENKKPRWRPHLADGKPCDCRMVYSDDPAAYAAAHPAKRMADGSTFNESIDEARRARNRVVPYSF